ncbi:hypothetical protein IFM89_028073 [Coptis chinensis]|uniref:eRF1/Pelota-like N-terminal domain-containing protein n=1 Tax=Coptis chinensis TaxID=261450 RepID=A0A835LT39_9MAGN|nr:hypothetical protein IFM89_028073 [Coptis chinensis]
MQVVGQSAKYGLDLGCNNYVPMLVKTWFNGVQTAMYLTMVFITFTCRMKIVRRDYIRNGPGYVRMIPEESDDLWVAYNLMAVGDFVLADTVRKVLREAASGGRDAERVRLKLEIKLESIDYDKEGSVLRLRGKNVTQNEHVKVGQYHTLEIEMHRFTKDQFHKHLLLEAERRQLRPIIENKSRLLLVHTTGGYKHNLKEVLDAPSVMNLIKDTKAAQEVRAFKQFNEMMSSDPNRACYGPKHVEVAHEKMAIQTLLITDELFRNADIPTRKKYVDLVSSVKDIGGSALIFSSMHVSGEQLATLTGIAAILRFPLPELDDIEM